MYPAVTAGYMAPRARERLYAHMDAANVDLKGFTDAFYRRICFGRRDAVLDTLKYIKHETSTWLEITTLLIPGKNDAPHELEALSTWIYKELGPDVPLHFTAFHPDFKMLDVPATPPETLTMARRIAQQAGLRYIYTGNVHDEPGGTTYCPNCETPLIGRDWYELTRWDLKAGACATCGAKIPGLFEDRPGTWGARRLPVRIPHQPQRA